jgi:NAD-dependent DNA ligase
MSVDYDDQIAFYQFLKHHSDRWNKGEPLLTDEEFDGLVAVYRQKHGPFDYVRSAELIEERPGSRRRLPVYMGSLDKLREPGDIKSWARKHSGKQFIITPKIDGASFLIHYLPGGEIRTYGNATENMSIQMDHLIGYLDLPRIPVKSDLIVRGELIISKENFLKYQESNPDETYRNALIWVNSNTRRKVLDPKRLQYLEFVAYEQMVPIATHTSARLDRLRELGFQTVPYVRTETVDPSILERQLVEWITSYRYAIDGVVVYVDSPYQLERDRNPTYAFAFKQHHFKEVTVQKVTWNRNKGKITPLIWFEPFEWKLYDFEKSKEYKRTSGHNAKAIIDNKIGPGAVIQLRFNHPHWNWHQVVVKPSSEPSEPEGDWHWNETSVEALQVSESDESRIKKLEFFMRQAGIEHIKASTIRKLYDAGFKTVPQLIRVSARDIQSLERFDRKSAQRIVDGIRAGLERVQLGELMAGSCIFGRSFGKKKFQLIIEQIDIIDLGERLQEGLLSQGEVENLVLRIDGIGQKMAEEFAKKLSAFIDFLREVADLVPFLRQEEEKGGPVPDQEIDANGDKPVAPKMPQEIVLSDVTDKARYNRLIRDRGGSTSDHVTNKTSILVIGRESVQTTKRASAEKKIKQGHPIEIMTLKEFTERYDLG